MNRTTKPASGLLVLAVLATVVLSACLPLPTETLPPGTQAVTPNEVAPQVADQATVLPPAPQAPETAAPEPTASAVAPPSPLPLEGTLWLLESYMKVGWSEDQGPIVDVLPGSKLTLQFQGDNLHGNAGCNNYWATYEVTGNRIALKTGGSTQMACEEAIMAQELAYMEDLVAANSFTITGDQLQIAQGDGQTVLTYRASQPAPLVGTTWQLTTYNNGKEALVSTLAGTEITAVFGEDGTLSGSAGCNKYNAVYTSSDGPMTIEAPATTKMACADPEGVMDQETAYLAVLPLANTYSIVGDELQIADVEGNTLLGYNAVHAAGAAASAEPTSLPTAEAGTAPAIIGAPWQWVATLYGDGTKNVPADPGNYVIEFLPEGQLTVKADCNTATGTYILDGEQMSIEIAAGTLAACPPELLGDQFIKDLNAAESYVMDGEDLIVILKEEAGSMRLQVPEEAAAVSPSESTATPEPTAAASETPTVKPTAEAAMGGGLADILGVIWKWDGLTSTGGESYAVNNPEQYELMLLPTGTIRVKADCNNGSGTYWIEENNISIEVLTLTRMACAPESRSNDFVQALNKASTYKVEGGNLLLTVGEDDDTMKFSPAE